MTSALIREPLLHFTLLAMLIFAADAALAPPEAPAEEIFVPANRVIQMAQSFALTAQRSPTPEDLHRLVDDYVKEEVQVREALALGLDRDDSYIRHDKGLFVAFRGLRTRPMREPDCREGKKMEKDTLEQCVDITHL